MGAGAGSASRGPGAGDRLDDPGALDKSAPRGPGGRGREPIPTAAMDLPHRAPGPGARTDLEPEPDRSRRGIRPISANVFGADLVLLLKTIVIGARMAVSFR